MILIDARLVFFVETRELNCARARVEPAVDGNFVVVEKPFSVIDRFIDGGRCPGPRDSSGRARVIL